MIKRIAGVAFVVLVGVNSATPVAAQNTVWRIDPEHSTARLFLASSKNPSVNVNVGVARMSGIVGDIGGDPSGWVTPQCVREREAPRNYLGRALSAPRIFRSYLRQSRPWIGPRSLKTNNARGHQLWEKTFQAPYALGKRLNLCLAPTFTARCPRRLVRTSRERCAREPRYRGRRAIAC